LVGLQNSKSSQYGFNRSSHGQFVKDTLIILTLVVVWIVSMIITSSYGGCEFAFIMAVVIAINMFFFLKDLKTLNYGIRSKR
jgi:amino acid permease